MKGTSSELQSPNMHVVAVPVMLALAALVLPLCNIGNSLWLDESTTLYVVKDGLREIFQRVAEYQSQSPLYYFVVWVSTRIFGLNETALRLPSLISICIAAYFVAQISRKFSLTELWIYPGLIFLSFTEVSMLAITARPYSFGLCCGLIAFYFALELEEKYSLRSRILFGTASVFCVYTHYLLSPFVIMLYAYLFIAVPERRRSIVFDAFLALLCALPLLPQLRYIIGRRMAINYIPPPSLMRVAEQVFLPLKLLFGIISILGASMLCGEIPRRSAFGLPSRYFWLVLGLLIVPILLLASLSIASGASVFLDRFLVFRNACYAILVMWAILYTCKKINVAKIASIIFIVLCLLEARVLMQSEDWRTATAVVNNANLESRSSVLLWSGLIETNTVSWLRDETRKEYLASPLLLYKVNGEVSLLPWSVELPENRRYVDELVTALAAGGQKEIFFLARYESSWFDEFRGLMQKQGFAYKEFGRFGKVIAARFDRALPARMK